MNEAGGIELIDWKDACVLNDTDIQAFKTFIKQTPLSFFEIQNYLLKLRDDKSLVATQKYFVLKHYAVITEKNKLDSPYAIAINYIWSHLQELESPHLIKALGIIEKYEEVGNAFKSRVQWKLDRVREYHEQIAESYTLLHSEPENIGHTLRELDVVLKGIALRVSIASKRNQMRLRFGFNRTKELLECRVNRVRRHSLHLQERIEEEVETTQLNPASC